MTAQNLAPFHDLLGLLDIPSLLFLLLIPHVSQEKKKKTLIKKKKKEPPLATDISSHVFSSSFFLP